MPRAPRAKRPSASPAAGKGGRPEIPPAEGYELRILRALRRISRAIDLHSRVLWARHRVTAPQLVCLHSVVTHAPISTTALARDVHLSPSTVVGIVDRLEAAGLVRRARDDRDRRVVHVTATEAGRALATSAFPLQAQLAHALQALPELEQATIALSLERVVALMEAGSLDAAPILETRPIADSAADPAPDGGPAGAA
jgi:DNA-binding MarR family transcriptional regulator